MAVLKAMMRSRIWLRHHWCGTGKADGAREERRDNDEVNAIRLRKLDAMMTFCQVATGDDACAALCGMRDDMQVCR